MLNPFMAQAIEEAKKALDKNEVPVGTVIVKNDKIIARAHNLRETENQATYHAEILCIQEACNKLGTWRLDDCDLYVTLEPCPMCAGAIINARIRSVYFGAFDPKGGACGSVIDLFRGGAFNHTPILYAGIMEEPCENVLKEFFKKLR